MENLLKRTAQCTIQFEYCIQFSIYLRCNYLRTSHAIPCMIQIFAIVVINPNKTKRAQIHTQRNKRCDVCPKILSANFLHIMLWIIVHCNLCVVYNEITGRRIAVMWKWLSWWSYLLLATCYLLLPLLLLLFCFVSFFSTSAKRFRKSLAKMAKLIERLKAFFQFDFHICSASSPKISKLWSTHRLTPRKRITWECASFLSPLFVYFVSQISFMWGMHEIFFV